MLAGKYRHIIWDWNGTFVDDAHRYHELFLEACEARAAIRYASSGLSTSTIQNPAKNSIRNYSAGRDVLISLLLAPRVEF